MFSGSFDNVPAELIAIALKKSSRLSGFTKTFTFRQNLFPSDTVFGPDACKAVVSRHSDIMFLLVCRAFGKKPSTTVSVMRKKAQIKQAGFISACWNFLNVEILSMYSSDRKGFIDFSLVQEALFICSPIPIRPFLIASKKNNPKPSFWITFWSYFYGCQL